MLFFLIYYWPNIFFFKSTHIVLDNNSICINQPISELDSYFPSIIDLVQSQSSLKLNKDLIELILFKNRNEIFNANMLNSNLALINVTSTKVQSLLSNI